VIEVFDVVRVVGFCLRICFGDGYELQEFCAVRIVFEFFVFYYLLVCVYHGFRGSGV